VSRAARNSTGQRARSCPADSSAVWAIPLHNPNHSDSAPEGDLSAAIAGHSAYISVWQI
jgi:hypothetical protein